MQSSPIAVNVHPSQFPETVRRQLLNAFRTRLIPPKFHYDSVKQATRWLALHEAFSPARTDPTCLAAYDRAFERAAECLGKAPFHLIGLGTGGGTKEARLLSKLPSPPLHYTPIEASLPLAITSTQAVEHLLPLGNIHPWVCDLELADDLPTLLAQGMATTAQDPLRRLVTCFGILPNFEPESFLPKLSRLIRPSDLLLVSANLAPGDDYPAAVQGILPQYDNPLTREWLLTLLYDVGFERNQIQLVYHIGEGQFGAQRIEVYAKVITCCSLTIYDEHCTFQAGDNLRLFFSYRFQLQRVTNIFLHHGLRTIATSLSSTGQEAILLLEAIP